jgi:membrane-associated phospholipid phosphatase
MSWSGRPCGPLAPPWAPLAAAFAVALTGLIAALVWHSARLGPLDALAARTLVARSYREFHIAGKISDSLVYLAVAVALCMAAYAAVALRWLDAVLLALAAPALALGAEKVLKQLVDRRVSGSTVSHYPSGHLAVATAVALTLVLLLRSAGARPRTGTAVTAASGVLVALLAVTRQVDTAHLLSDVVGGMATGVAVTLAAALLLDHRHRG